MPGLERDEDAIAGDRPGDAAGLPQKVRRDQRTLGWQRLGDVARGACRAGRRGAMTDAASSDSAIRAMNLQDMVVPAPMHTL